MKSRTHFIEVKQEETQSYMTRESMWQKKTEKRNPQCLPLPLPCERSPQFKDHSSNS